MFSCEFCKISHNIFFKERFGRLLQHKHSLCLLSRLAFLPIQKRCHTYFLAEYFFGLICRLGTRVSSIFQALSQKSIFNPVEHLRLSFFDKNSLQLKPLKFMNHGIQHIQLPAAGNEKRLSNEHEHYLYRQIK